MLRNRSEVLKTLALSLLDCKGFRFPECEVILTSPTEDRRPDIDSETPDSETPDSETPNPTNKLFAANPNQR